MIELLYRDGLALDLSDQDEIGDVLEALAAGELVEAQFIIWVQRKVSRNDEAPV